jgi:hypothetical protein
MSTNQSLSVFTFLGNEDGRTFFCKILNLREFHGVFTCVRYHSLDEIYDALQSTTKL